jgi:hypothetical protein
MCYTVYHENLFISKEMFPPLSRWFYDIFTDTAITAARYGSLLNELSLSSSQLWRKYGGYDDLHGSGRQSVTPYTYGEDYYIIVCSSS